MPSEGGGWQGPAAESRARINALDREVVRLRDRQHELAESVAVITYLAEQVRDLADDVKQLAGVTERVSRRALERPTAAVVGQYLALIVAVAALLVAALHPGYP